MAGIMFIIKQCHPNQLFTIRNAIGAAMGEIHIKRFTCPDLQEIILFVSVNNPMAIIGARIVPICVPRINMI